MNESKEVVDVKCYSKEKGVSCQNVSKSGFLRDPRELNMACDWKTQTEESIPAT